MSSIYNPNGTLTAPSVAAQQSFPITSSTNTAPIVVQISSIPGFADQDTVEIVGHLVNTAANGVWVVTKIDSTHYSLNGSIGNGVGGGTGFAQDYSLTPVFTVPGDGDLANAANIVSPIEGIANTGPFLYRMSGRYRCINIYDVDFGNAGGSNYASFTTAASSTIQNISALQNLLFGAGSHPPTQTNDLLKFTLNLEAQVTTNGDGIFVYAGFSTNGGSYSAASGVSPALVFNTGGSVVLWVPFTIIGVLTPGANNKFDFSVMAEPSSPSAVQIVFSCLGHLTVEHYRLNG